MQQNKTVSQQKTINPVYWVPTAYFAMGIPFIAINLVSVFMFKDLGISDTQIAFWTSLIMMPWTLKFLWSPFLEMYRTKKFFVLVTELLSGVLFGIVAFSLFFDFADSKNLFFCRTFFETPLLCFMLPVVST